MRATPGQRGGQHLLGRLAGMFTLHVASAVRPPPDAFTVPVNENSFSAALDLGPDAFRNNDVVQEHGTEQERRGTRNSAWSRNGARPRNGPWSRNGAWSRNMSGPPGVGPWSGNGSVQERGRSGTARVAGRARRSAIRTAVQQQERSPAERSGTWRVPRNGHLVQERSRSVECLVQRHGRRRRLRRSRATGPHGGPRPGPRWSTGWSTPVGQRRVHAEPRPATSADDPRRRRRGGRRVAPPLRAGVGERCRGMVNARAE
jgi:hypothetical protein